MNLNLVLTFAALLQLLPAKLQAQDTLTIELNQSTKSLLPNYVLECRDVGFRKIEIQAESYGIEVDMTTFRLHGVSDRTIAKYIWWEVDVTDINGRTDVYPDGSELVLKKLTQKPLFGDCF